MFIAVWLQAHIILLSLSLPLLPHLTASAAAACGTAAPAGLSTAISNIVNALTGIGAAVCALGIAIGGLMRATSFGSERRISESNTAIACAVVGLLIVLLAQALGKWIGTLITPDCTPAFIHLLGAVRGF